MKPVADERRRLSALADIRAFANRSDADVSLSHLLDVVATLSSADEAAVFVYDADAGRLVNSRSTLSPHGGRASFALGEGVAGQVAATGRGLVASGEDGARLVATVGTHTPPRNVLCLPLLAGHSLQGVLSLIAEAVLWTEQDLVLLEPFADEAAALLLDRSLRAQLAARTEEIDLLTSMNAISPRFERQQYVLGQLANVIAELVHADACSFVLADSNGEFVLQPGFNVGGGGRAPLAPSLAPSLHAGEVLRSDPAGARVVPFEWLRDPVGSSLLVPFQLETGLALLYVRTQEPLRADAEQALRLAAAQAAHLIDNMHLYRTLQASYLDAVATLAGSIEARDPLTKGHSEAVSRYAVAFGRVLDLDHWTLESLRMSALLHDVGKIAVPDAILLKPGPLSAAEWATMRRHPELGEKIIRPLPISERLRPAVLHHHEHWDGRGYPHQLAGEDIPLIARITSIVDAYQVIVAPRPYKPARPLREALAEITRCAGSQFDPRLARIFCERVAEIDPERATHEVADRAA